MTEVFITDLENQLQARLVQSTLADQFPGLEATFDLEEMTKPFPCGHAVLRVAGAEIYAEKIIASVAGCGYQCQLLEDKICN